jgi:hypothetical protein
MGNDLRDLAMPRANVWMLGSWLACLSVCGCQSMMTANRSIRGQSPEGEATPAGYLMYQPVKGTLNDMGQAAKYAHGYKQPMQAAMSEARDAYQEHHNTETTYFSQNIYAGGNCPAPNCPPGGGAAYGGAPCPPPGYSQCPTGFCPRPDPPHAGNDLNWYPTHGYSYSYQRPNDLVYPQPVGNSGAGLGGAVVYPYYTHRGPSDFFRQ